MVNEGWKRYGELRMANYLTVKQVCEYIGIKDTETIYRYIRQKKLKAYKLGGKNSNRPWRIKLTDLELFVTGQEPEPEHTESTDRE